MSTLHLTPSGDPQSPIGWCNERGDCGGREGGEGLREAGKDGGGGGGKRRSEGGREGERGRGRGRENTVTQF